MSKLTFQPKQVVSKLLQSLNERGKDVLMRRYGLGKDTKKNTLEEIGGSYGITRERVRQIEDASLENVRKSKQYKEGEDAFGQLNKLIKDMGAVVSEKELLNSISKIESVQNCIHFMLVVGNPFYKNKEDADFNNRWYIDPELVKKVEESIKKLYQSLDNDEIVAESHMIERFLKNIEGLSEEYKNTEILRRWLSLSKKISQNPLGDWGKSSSTNISVKGIRDYAYLVIRRHGSPIHFKEVAESISKVFGKKAHVATTHNELIKDPRFILVGRGLYALSEWGYSTGIVRNVIRDLIKKNGPLNKDEILEKVLRERYVKENTVLVNLQNTKYFKKDNSGKYNIVA